MRVYEIKESGETTHVAFDGTKKECKDWYVSETDCDVNEIDSITVLPRKKWKEITVKFEEWGIEPFTTTIEELMVGCKNNEIICSTLFL